MKKIFLISIFLGLLISLGAQNRVNFDLNDLDTARVFGFHPDCNGANNAGVWEAENLVVLTENIYPSPENYDEMLVFVNFFDALFETYVDLTSSPNLPIDGGFGAYNGKPTYHVTTDMCPGYAGAASHGVLGNATGMGFYDLTTNRIIDGDTSFCQVYTYEMHRNFWWGTDVWCQKIGWYVDNNPAAWGHWTLAVNVANGSLLTDYLGVGVFEDPPYNDSEAFYHRNVDPFLYYLDHPEYNFDNNWLHGLLSYDWLPDVRGVNNLMTGLFIYSYENFGGYDWEKGFYTWLQSDEIIPDHNYSDFQNARDNSYRVWSMAADSSLLNFFESDIRWEVSQEAIDWVANKLNLPIIEPSALKGKVLSNNEIVLSWNDNNSDESGFTMERKLPSDPTFTEIETLPENTTTFTDNASGEYQYRIKTMNANYTSLYSNVCSINTAIVCPEAPIDLAIADVSSSWLTITWTNSVGSTVDGAEVSVINNENGNETLTILQGTDNSLIIQQLETNTSYTCKVRSFNVGGFSDFSEEIIGTTTDVKPSKPTLKPIETISDTELKLRWVDRSDNEEGFLIRRKTDGGLYAVVDTVDTNIETYLDINLTPNTTYFYKVKAYNSVGNSESSLEHSGTTGETGINDEGKQENNLLSAYPNPASDYLTIDFKKPELIKKTLKLYDANGSEVWKDEITVQSYTLSKKDFRTGIYLLNVQFDNGEAQSIKIVFE